MKKKSKKSLNKKTHRITWKNVLWCACTPIAVAGVAVAVALPMKYVNRPGNPPAVNDTITVETDKPSLSSINETANVSAISSAGRDVTLSCDIPGISSTSDYFNPKTGVVTYFDEAVEGRTITIIANDGMATKQTLKIDFNSIPRPDKSIYMTVDTNWVASKSVVITGTITPFNFDTPIISLALADPSLNNDNNKFDATKWSWDPATPDTFAIQNDGINGTWRLQVVANGTILSNTVLITVQNSIVPDDAYWTMDGSGNVTSTIIADTDTDILFNYDGSVNILFGYSTTVTTINFMNETVLVYMDVSRLPNLTFFSSQTPSPLSILDLSHNPLLQNIQLNNTNLLTLDVSHNPLLETFVVGSSRLQAIDVSHNPLLTTVEISDAFLTTLDLTCNPALQKAYVVRNNLYTLYLPDTPADVDLELEIGDNANLANIYTMAMQNPTGATFTILSAYGDNNPQYTYHLKPGSEATFAGGTYSGGDVAWTQGDDW